MQRAQKTSYVVAAIFATWVVAGMAAAQAPEQEKPRQEQKDEQAAVPMEVMAEKMSATASVEKVDTKKRRLTLRDEDGNQFKVNVPAEVKRLDEIKTGDMITVDYYSSVALALKKGEAGKPPSAEGTTMVERTPGKLPGGMMARKIKATAEVMKVDPAEHKVTLKGPGGELDTIHVTDPDMQADLAKLKKGDKIQASYAEAIAITVTPQQKQKKQGG